jgi:hypothetical protein
MPRGRPFQKGRAKTGGRRPGVRNRFTRDVKEAVLNALERLGGDDWLVKLGRREAKAFATLLSKTMPLQVTASRAGDDPDEIAAKVRQRLAEVEAKTSGRVIPALPSRSVPDGKD